MNAYQIAPPPPVPSHRAVTSALGLAVYTVGPEIGRQIVRAMLGARIKFLYVTHMYDLANGFRRQNAANTLFCRQSTEPDRRRTFRLVRGEPLSTSYGPDLYKEIFSADGSVAP